MPVYQPPPVPQAPPRPPAPQPELLKGAQILGQVGSDVILAAEVLAGVDELIEENRGRMPVDQLEIQRELLIREKLKRLIETKLIYHDARKEIPEENFPHIEKSLAKQFEENELKRMMKRAKVKTRRALDEKLCVLGTSLERQKRAFMQRALAQQWIRQQIKLDEEITHEQMLEYYYSHTAEFDNQARARWEELAVDISNYADKATAGETIAWMGNRLAAGFPFQQIAKEFSDGLTAEEGGRCDWTNQGSLASKDLDTALFTQPVGQLGRIIESSGRFYIIRVIERENAHRTSFVDAQGDIKDKIRQERTKKELQAYVAKLRETIPVWTVFDDKDLPQQVSGRADSPRR